MRRNASPQRGHIKNRVLLVILSLLVAFLTWFLIRYCTLETKLEAINLFQVPESASLENLKEVDLETFAVALDGETIAGGDLKNEVRPTASTAKMILGLAIMEVKPFNLGEQGEVLTITPEFYQKYLWYLNHGGSHTVVSEGEEISEYDALMAVFLPSSNNMADSLAIWAFGSIDNYREYATNMLNGWGISDTVIGEDASGFSETTTSTAADLAKIGTRVLENPVLREIVGTKQFTVPGAGLLKNTNGILGEQGIIGVKTGFIGDASGYCLVSGYDENGHIVTIALLNAATRDESFTKSLVLTDSLKDIIKAQTIVADGEIIGYYDSWWDGLIPIRAKGDFKELLYQEATVNSELTMDTDYDGKLKITINDKDYEIEVSADKFKTKPSFIDKTKRIFGWSAPREESRISNHGAKQESDEEAEEVDQKTKVIDEAAGFTQAVSNNCTIRYGKLMLINPNFMVEQDFITTRRKELVSLSSLYGIVEGNTHNGDNLLDAEAAEKMNELVRAYETDYPGHTLETRSCFRAVGTSCGRLCMATGASDHHTGLTCDLVDPVYGATLDTDHYNSHPDWQWLKSNSYKYGFIDRFPEAWAGGSMSEPLNVNENGSTGLYETWHYRYVGVPVATEIATGVYNNGEYDSLEHYLKTRGLVSDLKNGDCD